MHRSKFLAVLAALHLLVVPAYAGSGTITVLDSTGTTRTFDITTDGSGNYLWKDVICDQSAGANCATVDASNNLHIAGTVTAQQGTSPWVISGSVTANAGTNLNTSLLALEGGGNLATIAGAISASKMQIAGTVTAQQGTSPWVVNLTQVDGTALGVPVAWGSTPSGNVLSANVNCVTGCSASSSITGWAGSTIGTGTIQAFGATQATIGAGLVPAVNAYIANANVNGQTTSGASSPVVLASNQSVGDPCTFQTKTNVPISTASGTAALVTGVSAKKIYVCSLSLIVPAAVSVSLSEGSGATCGTSNQGGVIGVATNGTAANGLPLPANGGLTLGSGIGTIAQTATSANYLCLFQSSTAQLAGNLTYVQQ